MKSLLEVYGWLLGHWAVRSLMFQAEHAHISPLRLSFTGTLHVVRRAVTKFQRLEDVLKASWAVKKLSGHKL